MSELLQAAKAVIAEWDDRQIVGDRNLRAAVERAENSPANYNAWTARHSGKTVSPYELWTDATQAERERLRQKVAEIIRHEDFDDVMAVFDD